MINNKLFKSITSRIFKNIIKFYYKDINHRVNQIFEINKIIFLFCKIREKIKKDKILKNNYYCPTIFIRMSKIAKLLIYPIMYMEIIHIKNRIVMNKKVNLLAIFRKKENN